MKYIIVLCDGMADEPVEALSGQTPLQAARTPNMDALASRGTVGLLHTIPEGMAPGSDVANMSVLGYDPAKYYSGRSSLEALAQGVTLYPGDVSYRANLVTLTGEGPYETLTLADFSAGEIPRDEGRALIEALKPLALPLELSAGISYRNLLVRRGGQTGAALTPPHDIQGRCVAEYLPKGRYAQQLLDLQIQSRALLKDHPVNLRRLAEGKNPANSLWFWGEGTTPALPDFTALRGLRGGVVCAVDLIRGIGVAAGMRVVSPPTATGGMVTDYRAKAEAALGLLREDCDLVFIHIEAPDECGHHGDPVAKRTAIEQIDLHIVGFLRRAMEAAGEDWRMLVLPDHPTPVRIRTHTSDPVPFVLCDSRHPKEGPAAFSELTAAATGLYLPKGPDVMALMTAREP